MPPLAVCQPASAGTRHLVTRQVQSVTPQASHVGARPLQVCVETMMHLTCTNMPKEKLSDALEKVGLTPLYFLQPLGDYCCQCAV